MMKQMSEKKKIICIVAIVLSAFAIIVLCKVNMSNIEMYKRFIPNNISQTDFATIGRARAIRSDEWLVTSSSSFFEMNNNDGTTSVCDIMERIVNIPKWGFNILSNDMAYSFSTTVMYVILFISLLFFFRIFAKDDFFFIISASIIILFQSAIAWWNAPGTFAIFFACIDLFYYFFDNKSIVRKALCCIGLVLCLGYYLVNAYPAWMIPLGYLAAAIIISIYMQEGSIKFNKKDSIYIAITIIAIIVFAIIYLKTNATYFERIANTSYPGQRRSTGGNLDFAHIAYYLLGIKLPFENVNFLNNSEVSTFLSLFPIPFLVYVFERKNFKKKKIIEVCLIFATICYCYAFFGFPEFIAKITLWSMTTDNRVYIIGDMAMLLAVLFEIYYLRKREDNKRKVIISVALVVAYLAYIYWSQKEITGYLGNIIFCVTALVILLLDIAILKNKKRIVLVILLAVSVIAGGLVNPINIGTSVLEDTPLAMEIQKLDKEDEGNWITLEDMFISKYTKTQGANCLNALNYPPMLELYSPIGEKKDKKIYNRYAHVYVKIGESVKFKLLQADLFEVTITSETLKRWKVKYIISEKDIVLNDTTITVKKVYDDVDGYDIYKIF